MPTDPQIFGQKSPIGNVGAKKSVNRPKMGPKRSVNGPKTGRQTGRKRAENGAGKTRPGAAAEKVRFSSKMFEVLSRRRCVRTRWIRLLTFSRGSRCPRFFATE